ncbi:type II 3-dehydroquinate dehydratase [Caminibacter pacificus]|uniref:3-dehydroquinate dehydratase n=1 Tax=Caminibacter pacificus TaxID=1424653 RepID=A0AAJ4UY52_9BACT|nr:type II 3-dehydroquinate dehydratase [Caminibacter pacificus]NPA87220.1 type II 3-dehydroquinate dehydratase [Campylobacterota bacterium]QCI28689.1 type II 3-dehydroquinate dehydratase [Caminibacter pacificus]ROR40580.1 3-dehydroquinate dehydratase [Caminibacter pacificus]
MKIKVIHGPNLNMLGVREVQLYGPMKLEDINKNMEMAAKQNGFDIEFYQSNHEGDIVDAIQECLTDGTDGLIINPAALTHYSIAVRDAIAALRSNGMPVVEVHMTNTAAREEFRHKSMISPVVIGTITGFGPFSYHLGLVAIMQVLNEIKMAKEQKQGQ